MKFIHDHRAHLGVRAAGQRDVRQNFCRAAQHGRVGVDRSITGHHADIFRTEISAEAEEFLVNQRFNGTGVNRALPRAECFEMQGCRHQ